MGRQSHPKYSLRVSPYTLLYGKNAILPPNFLLPSLQLPQASRGSDIEILKSCINTLPKLEESRQKSKDQFYQHQDIFKRWFDKRKSEKGNFEIGDLVLKWDHPHDEKGKHTKFQHIWVGPYQIVENLSPSTYKLQDLQGQEESLLVNGLVLKQYFTQEFGEILYINKTFLFLILFIQFFFSNLF